MGTFDLAELGLTPAHRQEAARLDPTMHLARVSSQHKDFYQVITEEGESLAQVTGKMMHDAASPADYPAVGDWVLVDRPSDVDGPVIIHHLLARRSCFARRAAGTSAMLQVVAANVDTIFICMSLNRDFNLRRLERYLAIAWDSGAVPVVVLTKADLADDVPVRVAEVRSVAPGVEVLATSSLDSEGLDSLLHHLRRGTTIAFIGSSGVGKSTLINRLLGQDLLAGHPGPARR